MQALDCGPRALVHRDSTSRRSLAVENDLTAFDTLFRIPRRQVAIGHERTVRGSGGTSSIRWTRRCTFTGCGCTEQNEASEGNFVVLPSAPWQDKKMKFTPRLPGAILSLGSPRDLELSSGHDGNVSTQDGPQVQIDVGCGPHLRDAGHCIASLKIPLAQR